MNGGVATNYGGLSFSYTSSKRPFEFFAFNNIFNFPECIVDLAAVQIMTSAKYVLNVKEGWGKETNVFQDTTANYQLNMYNCYPPISKTVFRAEKRN